jgi:metal transporter CNNM
MNSPDNLWNTYAYLQQIQTNAISISVDASSNYSFLIGGLLDTLQQDGYSLQSITTNHLRSVSESQSAASSPESLIENLIPIIVCVICAGLASGLTQGLLALDFMEMKIKSQSGSAKEKEYANKVLPIIQNHHLLLVSLMLWNASATEALPIFLNRLVSEYISIIISVTLVLLFGEIIPASILTGPKQLQIAATLTPLVYLILGIFFPIAYPLSLLLDCLIGHDDAMTMYSRNEIVTMMQLQHAEALKRYNNNNNHSHSHSHSHSIASHSDRHHTNSSVVSRTNPLNNNHHTNNNSNNSNNSNNNMNLRDTMNADEVTIIGGALTYRDIRTSSVMTSFEEIFSISFNATLSYKLIYDIFKAGYSRIPVYRNDDKHDIVSLLLVKDLIFVDPNDEIPMINFIELFGRKPIFVWHDDLLGDILSLFRQERAHLALVRDVENNTEVSALSRV